MSATGEPAPVTVPAADPPGPVSTLPVPVTEVDIPEDGGFPAHELEPVPEPPKAADPVPEPQPKLVKKSAFQSRIDTLTAQREAEKKRADDALAQAELYRTMAEGNKPPVDPNAASSVTPPIVGLVPGSPEFQKAVKAEAEQMAANASAKDKIDKVLAAGNTEYKDFTDRCNVVASLGAGDRPDFMQIVTDPDIIPDGQKVIAQLADNPDEAARILALPTVQMTAALVKFQAEHSKPAPVRPLSNAPAPIKPIDGTSRADDTPKDTDDMATYAAKYRALQTKKLQEKQPSRFAKH